MVLRYSGIFSRSAKTAKGDQMDDDDKRMLSSALKDMHRDETLERALGRAIRKEKGDYKRYLNIIGELRDLARRKRMNLVEAARELIDE
jgi:hypothetical protein